jgi:hypothetical protein
VKVPESVFLEVIVPQVIVIGATFQEVIVPEVIPRNIVPKVKVIEGIVPYFDKS